MSDVTDLVVIPDQTTLVIDDVETVAIETDPTTDVVVEPGQTTVIVSDDETVVVSEDAQTVVIFTDSTVVVGADAAGPQGPPGAPGSTAQDIEVTAGTALSAGRLVSLSPTGAIYYDPSDLTNYGKAVGVTKHAAAALATVAIVVIGPLELVGAGFTPGSRFWAGPNGTLVTTPPSTGLVVPVGYAVDASNMVVQIESYLVVA